MASDLPSHAAPPGELPDAVAVMAIMRLPSNRRKDARAFFWRVHIRNLRGALADAGVAPDEIETMVERHGREVRQAYDESAASKRKARNAARVSRPSQHRNRKLLVDYTVPPPVGTEIGVSGKRAVLISVEPYVRKMTGEDSFLLTWNVEGRIGTTGLRSTGLSWVKGDGDVA